MKSIIVVMTVITIIAITGEATNTKPFNELLEVTPVIKGRCPTLGSTDYQVTVMGAGSSMIIGRASIDYNSTNLMRQSFNMWLGSLQHAEQRVEHFSFYCRSKSPSASENPNKEPSYVQLNGQITNKAGTPDLRCALYEMVNKNATMFRMAVSRNASCNGLSNMLSHPQLMTAESNNGSMLLLLNKIKLGAPLTPPLTNTTTTDEAIDLIATKYIVQNFGCQPNLDSSGSQSYVIDKTTKDKKLRQSQSTEHMQRLCQFQLRRRRSILNAKLRLRTDITPGPWRG